MPLALQVDLSKRYGCLAGGINDIKSHPWFRSVDFQALRQRSLPAPIRPAVAGPDDTSNFEEQDLPPLSHEFVLSQAEQALFTGF